MQPISWQLPLRLAHFILWIIRERATETEWHIRERAVALSEALEYDQDTYDLDEEEDPQEPLEYLEYVPPTDEEDPEHEQPRNLLEALGLSWVGLVEGIRCFDEQAMCLSLVQQINGVTAFLRDIAADDELEALISAALGDSSLQEDVADLRPLWKGFDNLANVLSEEALVQWLLTGEFLTRSCTFHSPKVPTNQEVQEAITSMMRSRSNGRVDLDSHFKNAYLNVNRRLCELARCNAPDSDQQRELYEQQGGELTANAAVCGLEAAARQFGICTSSQDV